MNVKCRSQLKYSLSISSSHGCCRGWMHTRGLTLKVTVSPSELLPCFSAEGTLCTGDSKELNRVLKAGTLSASGSEGKKDGKSQPSWTGKAGLELPFRWRQQTYLIKNLFFIIRKLYAASPTGRHCRHHKRWQQSLMDGNGWTEPRTNQDEFLF